ncbi:MAG: thioredoxin-disulfide reductase [Kiritimatiellia bacterium]|jgi:thioredoxin reductase (NADPH)|nr:thioredoxin-disulfide reductase [Kiritimatiellia bacterium]
MEDVVILGSGPAGLCAALYTARANLSPVVVEGLQPGGQLTTTTEVENYPGFPEPCDGTDLVMRMRSQAERFGTRYIADEVVATDLQPGKLTISLSGGDQLETRTLIIATGASARYLGLPSEQRLIGKGVSGCATCDGAFYRGQKVAVVGGGDTAMEDALFLSRLVEHVTVIHRRDALRASQIMGDRVLANEKITVAWECVVDEVLGEDGVEGVRLRNVKTGDVSEIAVTGFFVAIGHDPNTTIFADQLDVDEQGFLVTTNTRTSIPGVYAAGDVQDPLYKQAVTAAGTGCMAALEAERFLATAEA